MRHGGAGARQMTTISLNDSCSRAYQLCASESGNTNAARPSSVSTSSTQNSQTMSPTMVFCARARAPAPLSAGTLREKREICFSPQTCAMRETACSQHALAVCPDLFF